MNGAQASWLLGTAAIRERTGNILAAAHARRSAHFRVHEERLIATAEAVAAVTLARYPTLNIPYHSRWRHFEVGGIDRWPTLWTGHGGGADLAERARSEIDLAVVSVLLDAGAGAAWRFDEPAGSASITRSEGLAVASIHAFAAGLFADDPGRPLRADAAALQRLDDTALAVAFQVRDDNPLVGVPGRTQLLRALGRAVATQTRWFGAAGRPGGLFDVLTGQGRVREVSAERILEALLHGLGGIWPAGNELDGLALGDTWPHPNAGGHGRTAGRVPLHKLSQWLTYSLLEPFERAGIAVTGLDALTALAEYRNGGLLIDSGVIEPIDPALASRPLAPSSEPIVEWRALTVALMEPLAQQVRERLGRSADELPLARILEGGTWAAGRVLANRLRDGSPPLNLVSDGTVF